MKPATKQPHLGLEFEVIFPVESLPVYGNDPRQKIEELQGLDVEVGDDGSIESDNWEDESAEVRLLTTHKAFEADVTKLLTHLNYLGAKVNWSCGVHIHVDARYRDKNRLFKRFVQAQPLLYSTTSLARQSQPFSPPAPITEREILWAGYDPEGVRHARMGVSLSSRHQTVELRMFEGTLNTEKVLLWCALAISIKTGKPLNKKYAKLLKKYAIFPKAYERTLKNACQQN